MIFALPGFLVLSLIEALLNVEDTVNKVREYRKNFLRLAL